MIPVPAGKPIRRPGVKPKMSSSNRMPLIDVLKAVASQLIVLHHFSAYGPLGEAMEDLMPSLQAWLFDYGRMAVQVFLVIGGFLAARSLAPKGHAAFGDPLSLVWKRYQRLVVPFVGALLLAILCAAVARAWLDDEAIPDKATLPQFFAHALLLQNLLDFDALSAGVWYVAIDFQLFALFAFTLAFARAMAGRQPVNPAPFLVCGLALASLFYFNLDAGWDNFGLYFFGSYALGAGAFWAADRRRSIGWLGAIWTFGILALLLDFRLRIAIAFAVAMTLAVGQRRGLVERWGDFDLTAFLARISYSVFLVHFPIYLLVNALYDRYAPDGDFPVMVALAAAWASSIVAGYAFHHLVESRSPGEWLALVRRFGQRFILGSAR